MKRIAVIGAGIAGISAAYYLSKSGHRVTIFEQERYLAMRASRANGGQISVSNSEVWNTWGNVRRAVGWLGNPDAPLLVRLGFETSRYLWLSKFLWHTYQQKYQTNTEQTIDLGLQHRRLLDEIHQEHSLAYDYSKSGIMHVYKDEKYFEQAKNAQKLYENNGCQWQILSPKEASKLDNSLNQIPGFIGAAWTADDAVGDMHKFCNELTTAMIEKYHVTLVKNNPIDHLNELSDFDDVVIAAGVDSNRFAQQLGDKLDIYPVKGYSITIDLDKRSQFFCPRVSLLDDQAKIVTSTLGNRLRVAGTAELNGYNRDHRMDRIQPLLSWVERNLPGVNTKNYTTWACLRPMAPDMMPIVKPSKRSGFWYHTGHGHLGWTLSLATADKLAEQINNQ